MRITQRPHRGERLFSGVYALVASLLVALPVYATNHQVQIDEVMGGCAGNSAIQFVEMRMCCLMQNEWGPQDDETASRALLVFFNDAGVKTGEFAFPSDPPEPDVGPGSDPNRDGSVLIATAAFAAIPGAPAPDFIMPANIMVPDGMVCFRDNPVNSLFEVNLCLSYGSFTGTEPACGPGSPAAALPVSGASSLRRTEIPGPFGPCTQSNADFALDTPAPKNAAGSSMNLFDVAGDCVAAPAPAPTPTPIATPVCEAAPQAGCRTPAVARKASLMLKGGPSADKHRMLWKWLQGSATSKADFGDPTTTTAYQLCIYDGTPSLVSSATIPAGAICGSKACWQDKATGFQYRDKELTPHGVARLTLKEGLAAGKAQIQAQGQGALFPLPAIPLTQPVRVQLKNSAVCWEAVYGAPATRNTAGPPPQFKDIAD